MYLARTFTVSLPLTLLATTALAVPPAAPIPAKSPTSTVNAATSVSAGTSVSLTYDPTNSAILIPASRPITGLNPQCNSYETVRETDANNVQNDLATGHVLERCCTTGTNNCALLDFNHTAAVQLCSTGGSQCTLCVDLAIAMKAIVTSCSATLLASSPLVGGQVIIPWMVNTTLQINPAKSEMAPSEYPR